MDRGDENETEREVLRLADGQDTLFLYMRESKRFFERGGVDTLVFWYGKVLDEDE